jgi:hypothetical protein
MLLTSWLLQIIQALLERATGSYHDLSGCSDANFLAAMAVVRGQAVDLLTQFKEENTEAWNAFGVLIHANVLDSVNSESTLRKALDLLQSYDLATRTYS